MPITKLRHELAKDSGRAGVNLESLEYCASDSLAQRQDLNIGSEGPCLVTVGATPRSSCSLNTSTTLIMVKASFKRRFSRTEVTESAYQPIDPFLFGLTMTISSVIYVGVYLQ